MELKHVTHESIPLFIDKNSEVLILGSLPSVKSRVFGFYYGHPRNRFFLVLSQIFHEDEPLSIEERKSFLKRHKIALYDVIYECDIKGSSDSSISNPKVIPLVEILEQYPNIKRILVNGSKAKQLFKRHLLKQIDTEKIKVCWVPSTSSANVRYSTDRLVEHYSIALIQ